MSVSDEVTPGAEEQVRSIPEPNEREAPFHDRASYEKWRNARYSERARRLVREAMADADRLKAEGITDEEIDRRLLAVIDRIAPPS
jgi:hypothetical protein